MAMTGPEIEGLIKVAFPESEVVITDLAGDGDHFAARVVSSAFSGKSRVQQHQMVYAALREQMGGALHALALETATPKCMDSILLTSTHRIKSWGFAHDADDQSQN